MPAIGCWRRSGNTAGSVSQSPETVTRCAAATSSGTSSWWSVPGPTGSTTHAATAWTASGARSRTFAPRWTSVSVNSIEPDQALRLVTALPWPWWWGQGYFAEGRRWLRLGLAKAEFRTALRARALVLGAELSLGQGDTSTATRLLEEGTQLAQRLQDTPTIAHADAARGLAVLFHGEPHMALDPLLRARDALSSGQRPDTDQLLFVLLALGLAAAHVRDRDLAETCRSDILAITRGGPALGQAMFMFGVIAWTLDDSQQAGEDAEACLRFARDHGLSGRHSSAWALEVLAWVAGSQGKHRRAATLLGAAEALLADIGSSVVAFPHLIDYHGACEQQARDALGSAFDENILKGRTMSYEDAVTYALGAQPKTPATEKDSRERSYPP